VEVWIGAGAAPAIDRAARLGDGWLAGPEFPLAEARARLAHYRERCQAHGRTPSAIAIRRDVYVAESAADAQATVAPIVGRGYRGFDPDALVVGTAGEVAARFAELGALGYTDVIVRHVTDDQPRVLASMARLAEVRRAVQGV